MLTIHLAEAPRRVIQREATWQGSTLRVTELYEVDATPEGITLRLERERLGLTVVGAARVLGCDVAVLRGLELGRVVLREPAQIAEILRVLGGGA